jgi:hypothetical protein
VGEAFLLEQLFAEKGDFSGNSGGREMMLLPVGQFRVAPLGLRELIWVAFPRFHTWAIVVPSLREGRDWRIRFRSDGYTATSGRSRNGVGSRLNISDRPSLLLI